MENNLLKVRMFGGFSLEFNDKEVDVKKEQ